MKNYEVHWRLHSDSFRTDSFSPYVEFVFLRMTSRFVDPSVKYLCLYMIFISIGLVAFVRADFPNIG